MHTSQSLRAWNVMRGWICLRNWKGLQRKRSCFQDTITLFLLIIKQTAVYQPVGLAPLVGFGQLGGHGVSKIISINESRKICTVIKVNALKKERLHEINLHSNRRGQPILRMVLLFQEVHSYDYIYFCAIL
jgi:hypothetical protein